jgi:UDP-N-acetylglucosamine 2-epimerase
MGANMLVGSTKDRIVAQAHQVLAAKETSKNRPPLWDGNAGARILDGLDAELSAGLK